MSRRLTLDPARVPKKERGFSPLLPQTPNPSRCPLFPPARRSPNHFRPFLLLLLLLHRRLSTKSFVSMISFTRGGDETRDADDDLLAPDPPTSERSQSHPSPGEKRRWEPSRRKLRTARRREKTYVRTHIHMCHCYIRVRRINGPASPHHQFTHLRVQES